MLLALLFPLNLGLLKLCDNFVQSPNLLKQKAGLFGIHMLVQLPYNRRKLLRDGVCSTLTTQMQHYIESVKQGDVSSWNAEFDRNLDIMDLLVDDENVEKHALESGFYDTLLANLPLLEDRLSESSRFLMHHLIVVLSEHARVPLHQQNPDHFYHILSQLMKQGEEALPTLSLLIHIFSERSPTLRDSKIRNRILSGLHVGPPPSPPH